VDDEREGTSAACCEHPTDRISEHFDAAVAELEASGQATGLSDISKCLLALLLEVGPAGKTILELGSGRGGLLLGLAQAGAARVTGVDLSPSSIQFARRRFETAGLSDRAEFVLGNGALVDLEPHDWVILDRAICCYPDLDRFLANSVPVARSLYAFSVPESRGLRGVAARIWFRADNLLDRFRGHSCTGFVHDLDRIEGRLESAGFRRSGRGTFGVWHIAVHEAPTG
jgi:SAM-dependent methyltransferase